jgi:hypothetical protein
MIFLRLQPHSMTEHQKNKKLKGLCITPFCTKKHREGRNCCHSCIENLKKKNNPLFYTYYTWQRNSKRRKKVNTVTFEEFKIFVGETDYMRKRGRGAKKFTIARKRECTPTCPREWCQAHGYHAYNIESVELAENVRKYHRENRKNNYDEVPF